MIKRLRPPCTLDRFPGVQGVYGVFFPLSKHIQECGALVLRLLLSACWHYRLAVAITFLGVRTGHMAPENASALVGAAVLTVAIFPTLAAWLRAEPESARPDRDITRALCQVGDRLSAQYLQLATLIAPSRIRKP